MRARIVPSEAERSIPPEVLEPIWRQLSVALTRWTCSAPRTRQLGGTAHISGVSSLEILRVSFQSINQICYRNHRSLHSELEPSEGVEPPSSTYEVDALPLSYVGTRIE